jgi:hypothetical protein
MRVNTSMAASTVTSRATSKVLLGGVAVAVLVLASGCGAAHKASAAAHAAKAVASAASNPTAAGAAGAVDTGVSLRVANLFSSTRTPGGPLDIYDVRLDPNATVKPTPLLAGVAYGAFSDYVHPHSQTSIGQKTIELYALPAGEDPVTQAADAQGIGGLLDDGSGPQVTLVLQAPGDTDTLLAGPLAGLSFSTVIEKGDDGQGGKGPVAPPATGGNGEILASYNAASNTVPGANGYYLFVDSSCTPPLNGDPNVKGLPEIFAADGATPVSSYAVFAAAPGAHHLTVVVRGGGVEATCSELKPRQGGVDVTLTAGQQVLTYVYGTKDDLHLALGPVAP